MTEQKNTLGLLEPPDYSDAGNAEIFVSICRDSLMYTDSLGWLWWDGQRWNRGDHKPTEWALGLTAQMLEEAVLVNKMVLSELAEAQAKFDETGAEEDKEDVTRAKRKAQRTKAYLTHAQRSRDARKIKAMLELSKPALVVRADTLDADPFALNTPGGIVDLLTGQIRPHDKEAYCTKMTLCAPSDQGAAMWDSFLDTITCQDPSLKGFLQMVAGMALIGKVFHEGIILAYGGGRNGKSTFFNALGQVLGDYAGSVDVKILTTERGNRGASLATLRGRRLVIAGELEENHRLSVSTLKQLASTDEIVVEEKFRQPETIKPSHSLVLFTNFLPRVGSTDSGTWRRLIVVPFNAIIPTGSGVQNYGDKLTSEAGGAILSWAIEGTALFVRNGFKLDIPDVVAEATADYRDREDWLQNFIQECCVLDPNARVGASDLYQEYKAWATGTGDYVRRNTEFKNAMEVAGFKQIAPKNKKTWIGLRIDLAQKFENPYVSRAF